MTITFGNLDSPYPTPVGQPCLWCKEPIQEGDKGVVMPNVSGIAIAEAKVSLEPTHYECLMRQILGSVGHQKGLCSCYGGTEEDPPGLSKREAACAAYQHSRRRI